MKRILLTGNSQCVALKLALDRRQREGRSFEDISLKVLPIGAGREMLGRFFAVRNDEVVTISASYPSLTFSKGQQSYDYVGIGAPFYSLGLTANTSWKIFSLPDVWGSKVPVSRALFKTAVLEYQKPALDFITALTEKGVRVFVYEAARLFAHHEILMSIGLETVANVDRQYRAIIKAELEKRGVPIVFLPEACINAEGFTRNEYRLEKEGDQNHGNVELGEALVQEIRRQALEWA